jgi:hypothetical protein
MMNDTIFHVYDKDNKVVAHSLSNHSLAEKVLNDEIDIVDHEIVAVEDKKFREASY